MQTFKRKLTTSIQFTEAQMNWLENQARVMSIREERKVSLSEITRNAVQAKIDAEKLQAKAV